MNDVCLVLEGTYPYVAGGVSTWVYDLIRNLPDTTFSILYLGAHRLGFKKMHYEIPENVKEFREYYLFDYRVEPERSLRPRPEDFELLEQFLREIKVGKIDLFERVEKMLGRPETRSLSLHDLLHSWQGWRLFEKLYDAESEETSLIDYFWTWRFLYAPFFSLLRVELPEASVYHSASTGYAGVLGAVCKLRSGRPFVLTEHGIYTRERKIEIEKADWIYSETAQQLKVLERKDFFKDWWTRLFELFSRISYQYADEITTLYEGNRRIQIEEGADPKKIRTIPNGVQLENYEPRRAEMGQRPCRIGLVGRVVPIKDIKTFIRACGIVHHEIPSFEAWVLGPTDEDEDYFRDCAHLVEMESLGRVIQFKGKVNLRDYYPEIDVLVLTSISEGQPIVMLEAMASGIPVVATDVGSCAELIGGKSADDKFLGECGVVTPVCDPQETAGAILKILKNPGLSREMGEAGRRRTETYYRLDDVISAYQMIYDRFHEEIRWPA